MVRLLLSLLLILIPAPAFAEDVVTPVVEPSVEAYVPPAEASNGVGGWAVVDPATNTVHGVIVCTIDVCGPNGSWNGVLPGEYMGCTNCNLRFQTNHTSDGNVAGYSGAGVTWNESSRDFTIVNDNSVNGETNTTKRKLIPSKTASDGKGVETGIVDIETVYQSTKIIDNSVNIKVVQKDISSPSSITVYYPAWLTLKYNSVDSLKNNLETDVDNALVDEPEALTKTIKTLTEKVKTFFGMIFGGTNERLA